MGDPSRWSQPGGSNSFLNCMKRGAPFFLSGLGVGLADQTAGAPATDREQLWRFPNFPVPVVKAWPGACCTHGSVAIAKPLFPKQKCQKRTVLISFPSETGSAL